jgi:glutamine amidotransferase
MTTIIDYGMGNLYSLQNALSYLGEESIISSDPNVIRKANKLILPGVGSFGEAMRNIKDKSLDQAIHEVVITKGFPFLGICLGMQLLAYEGEEDGRHKGLAYVDGTVKKLSGTNLRLPHIGFNAVETKLCSKSLFKDIPNCSDFYFVHTYHFVCTHEENVSGTTVYANPFISAVQKDNIYGVQFHPEKSQSNGLRLLSNFLQISKKN